MSTEMGRYPPALWKPVPSFGYPEATRGQLRANGPKGAFFHDAQGWAHGALARFQNPANQGSAHIIINLAGPPHQFIDFDDAAWHAGGYIPGLGTFANLFHWGFEFEGGYPTPEPINDHQVDVALDLCRWLATEYAFKWPAVRRVDLWEHREVYPTSCPSDRIRWPDIIAGLKGDAMTTQDWRARRHISGLLRQAAGHLHVAAGLADVAWSQDEYLSLRDHILLAEGTLTHARQVLRDTGLGPETAHTKIDTFK